MKAVTEHIRKTELLFIERGAIEQSKGMDDEAPIARPCRLTYDGNSGSDVKTAKNTDDSLNERICKDIDEAKTWRCRQEYKIQNKRTVVIALATREHIESISGIMQRIEW
jgi:hypothetical protein